MFIKQLSIWRKTPEANGRSHSWGGDKVVIAATDNFVIIRNDFVSKYSPQLNKEEVIPRADFERDYVTKEEASRRIEMAARRTINELSINKDYKLRSAVEPKPELGKPALLDCDSGGLRYITSNGVTIRFTMMGHYYIDKGDRRNPVSSYDAEWIAAKSVELRKAYEARSSYCYMPKTSFYNHF